MSYSSISRSIRPCTSHHVSKSADVAAGEAGGSGSLALISGKVERNWMASSRTGKKGNRQSIAPSASVLSPERRATREIGQKSLTWIFSSIQAFFSANLFACGVLSKMQNSSKGARGRTW